MTDDVLRQQFEDLSYPFDQWTHRAHVRLAFIYLGNHSFAEAMERLRTGIKAYNEKNQVPEGPLSGYNETTTYAFLILVAATMSAYGKLLETPDSDSFCDRHTRLMNRNVLRLFYSPAQRSHPDAKTKFVEPDLAPPCQRSSILPITSNICYKCNYGTRSDQYWSVARRKVMSDQKATISRFTHQY